MTVREGCRKGSEEAYVRRGCEGLSEGETERGIRTYVLTLSRGQARERERDLERKRERDTKRQKERQRDNVWKGKRGRGKEITSDRDKKCGKEREEEAIRGTYVERERVTDEYVRSVRTYVARGGER